MQDVITNDWASMSDDMVELFSAGTKAFGAESVNANDVLQDDGQVVEAVERRY